MPSFGDAIERLLFQRRAFLGRTTSERVNEILFRILVRFVSSCDPPILPPASATFVAFRLPASSDAFLAE